MKNVNVSEYEQFESESLNDLLGNSHKGCWRGITIQAQRIAISSVETECKPFIQKEKNNFKTDRWVGSINLSDEIITIKPRVGWVRFKAMTMNVLGISLVETGGNIGENAPYINDLIALAWTASLDMSLHKQGVVKGYVERHETDLSSLLGRLDVREQITLNHTRQHMFACHYDDLTFDNPINHSILFVINHLKQHKQFPFKVAGIDASQFRVILNRWRERLLALGVQQPVNLPTKALRWSRANAAYQIPYELASLVVRNKSAIHGRKVWEQSIWLDSAEIWESFLLGRLKAAIDIVNEDHNRKYKVKSPRLDGKRMDTLLTSRCGNRRGLIPDYIITDVNNEKVAILDAKYRELHSDKVPHDDSISQMALYALRYRKDNKSIPCVLIYPRVIPGDEAKGINNGWKENFIRCGMLTKDEKSNENEGKQQLLWWAINMQNPNDGKAWIRNVDKQLSDNICSLLVDNTQCTCS